MKYQSPQTSTGIPDAKQYQFIVSDTIDSDGVHHVVYGTCPECDSQYYLQDYHRGECCCAKCGLVLDSREYDNTRIDEVITDKEERAKQRFNQSELKYISRENLALRQKPGFNENWDARNWRWISMYGSRLNVYMVDRKNIQQFIRCENLQPLKIRVNKIILGLMKYIVGNRKYQEVRIDRGLFREEGLTRREYERIRDFLYKKDDGRYGIVREKDLKKKGGRIEW